MFLVFTSFHRPCFSTSNLLWNCCRFCKWCFISPPHLTCNKFNVHGIAHMKHLPSMSPLHPKYNHCQRGLLLPPTECPWTLCFLFLKKPPDSLAPHKFFWDIWQSWIEAPCRPTPRPQIEALSCFPLVPYNLHTWKLKCIWDKIELLLGTP